MRHNTRRSPHLRLAALGSVAALALAGCSAAISTADDNTAPPPPSSPSTSSPPSPSVSPTSSTSTPPSPTTDDADAAQLVTWPKGAPVPHLFFHSLVVDPELAFDGDDMAQGYDDYMATVPEFTRTLEALLERDYVLVDPHDIATIGEDGTMQYRPLRLPEGHTPIVLSLDDLSYYEYMSGDGFPDRLVLDEGRVRTVYTDPSGQEEVGAHDVVPILDDFVEEHPEFSHEGAKGVIAMTGYDGVLGYRTSQRSHGQRPDIAEQQAAATEIAEAMKGDGWTFASHTWGHLTMTGLPLARVQADQERWEQEVEPIVGETDMLIYPFGADISGVDPYTGPVYEYLRSQGYDYFFNVDGTRAWQQMGVGYLRQGRMNVDGIMLRKNLSGQSDALAPFMDVAEVIDSERD